MKLQKIILHLHNRDDSNSRDANNSRDHNNSWETKNAHSSNTCKIANSRVNRMAEATLASQQQHQQGLLATAEMLATEGTSTTSDHKHLCQLGSLKWRLS
jgi:hypothetical protein